MVNIAGICTERPRTVYFDYFRDASNVETNREHNLNKSDVWLELAIEVDKYARICVSQALHNSALELNTRQQEEWLECEPQLKEDYDVKIIKFILHKESGDGLIDSKDDSKKDFIKKIKAEKLKSNIAFLRNFQQFHIKLLKDLDQRLANLE